MTTVEASKLIGREGALRVSPSMAVAIRVLDVKFTYGCRRYRVEPLVGLGAEWVDEGRVVLSEEGR